MSKQGGIKDVAVGRTDIYRMDPRDLHVKDGWNCRDLSTPDAQESLKDLARSIAEIGVKQPLTVYWEDGKAFLSDGHRRLRATLMAIEGGAEIKSVPVFTEDRYSSEADRVFSQIIRNSGEPLKPIEQAAVFKRLIGFGWSVADIASRAGLSRQWVTSLLDLQAAPAEVTDMVRSGSVSASTAISALRAAQGDQRQAAGQLAEAVSEARAQGKSRATAKHLPQAPSLRDELKAIFESLTPERDTVTGSVLVEFSEEQFERVADLLKMETHS